MPAPAGKGGKDRSENPQPSMKGSLHLTNEGVCGNVWSHFGLIQPGTGGAGWWAQLGVLQAGSGQRPGAVNPLMKSPSKSSGSECQQCKTEEPYYGPTHDFAAYSFAALQRKLSFKKKYYLAI